MTPSESQVFSPCFVVPNYNHRDAFQSVIEQLATFALPIVVVNDGSDEATTQLIRKVADGQPLIRLVERAQNGGKGAAVKDGLIYAAKAGHSHAMQIDADGQHHLQDIPDFLETAKAHPKAMISGYPQYDESVPTGRLISRYLTHVWVWIETLSFRIKDSMCGFRVYPLAATTSLIKQVSLGDRMNFDTEVLVRLYWQNIDMIFLPTKVTYPENGVSHFLLWRDNWLITKMHTRLFFGMLYRLPALLKRKLTGNKPTRTSPGKDKSTDDELHWGARKERGSYIGIRFLVAVYRVLGRRAFSLVLYPVVFYFALFAGSARRASKRYLQQIHQTNDQIPAPGFREVLRHFYEFACSAIDKIAVWNDDIQRKDVLIHHQSAFDNIRKSGKGAVFIGSHLGNIEICRALGEKDQNFKLNAVVYNKHALKFHRALTQTNQNVDVNLIHVEQFDATTAMLLDEKIQRGEIVIIVGDRTSLTSHGRSIEVDFLGKPAPFGEGPFVLASVLDCPVYLLFCLNIDNQYNIYLEHFSESLKLPRKNRQQVLAKIIQDYAKRLEFYCLKAPFQWFNFFDFWLEDKPDKTIRREQKPEIMNHHQH